MDKVPSNFSEHTYASQGMIPFSFSVTITFPEAVFYTPQAIGQIVMKFDEYIHAPQKMNFVILGDSMTFSLAPALGQKV